MVFAATQRLLRALEDFSEEVGVLKGHLAGQLRIGHVDCTATDSSSRLHDAIGRFLARPNDVMLHLHQEIPQVLQEKVLKGEYHLGIGSFPHKIKGLEYTPLYREEHGLYCGRSHSLFDVAAPELDMARLREEPIVSRGYWRDEHRKTLGFDNVAAITHQMEPQLVSILSGRYLGFLPMHYARWWVERGELRRQGGRRHPLCLRIRPHREKGIPQDAGRGDVCRRSPGRLWRMTCIRVRQSKSSGIVIQSSPLSP